MSNNLEPNQSTCPQLSVIIPAYNAEKSIFQCLDSIEKSNYPKDKVEVFVIDNNSTDETAIIAERFGVTVHKETRQGRSIARNTGASLAKSDFLFFLDADVYVEPDYFNHVIEILQRPGIGGVQGAIIPSDIDGQDSINKFRYQSISKGTGKTFCLLNLMVRESPMINSAACAYRCEAFNLVGGFDSLLERHEDIDLAKRVCYSGYTLASCEQARAHVIYHGEGWPSYFLRSFSEGFTKIDYFRKWSLPQKWVGLEDDEAYMREEVGRLNAKIDSSSDKHSFDPKVKGLDPSDLIGVDGPTRKGRIRLYHYAYWVLRDNANAISGFLKTFDTYYLIHFININCKILGHLCSYLRKPRHEGELIIPMAPKNIRLKVIKEKRGKAHFFKPTLRFVLLKRHIYVVDIDGDRIYSGTTHNPHLFSYTTFHNLGLFLEFDGSMSEDFTVQMFKTMKLVQ